jgi:hypothetical protein
MLTVGGQGILPEDAINISLKNFGDVEIDVGQSMHLIIPTSTISQAASPICTCKKTGRVSVEWSNT